MSDNVNLQDFIDEARDTGKIFTICFIKRSTGERRVMNCRLGVRKYLAGGSLPYDPKQKDLLAVFDVQIQDYRMISLNSIQWLRFASREWTFDIAKREFVPT